MRCLLPILLLAAASGCARYEFDLVEPAELAGRVGRKEFTTVAREPLEYRLQSYEGRLVMRIGNPSGEAVELVGEESYVVDPEGQSRPLRSQAIAPHSYIQLVFPPLREVYRAAPAFGIGIGVGAVYHSYYGPYGPWGYPWYDPWLYDPWWGAPEYLVVYDDGTAAHWTWKDQSSVRMRLVFRRGDDTFRHEFLFRRVKL